jgi:valyl-tRNA synthetase
MSGALQMEEAAIKTLAQVESLVLNGAEAGGDSNDSVSLVLSSGTVVVPLSGLVDLDRERERLVAELDDVARNLARLSNRLDDERFLSRAPEEVVDKERDRLAASQERHNRIEETLARLGR